MDGVAMITNKAFAVISVRLPPDDLFTALTTEIHVVLPYLTATLMATL